ncbi:MAG: shikimate dehydrogenase [Actinomycetota bacterium]
MRKPAISGSTTLACILGHPASHSLSPAIHNAAFEALGLDWIYLAFDVPPSSLSEAIAGLKAVGVGGVNITMPHKQNVMRHLDEISDEARLIGAVNTIVSRNGALRGENTDGAGFVQFLTREVRSNLDGAKVLLLGAGGSARAIAIALAQQNVHVQLSARRLEQAQQVARESNADAVDWEHRSEAAREADIVINATPVNDQLPIEELTEKQIVIDLIYFPKETALIHAARKAGATAFNGLGMLLHQAMLSFELWTGQKAPESVMRAAIGAQL